MRRPEPIAYAQHDELGTLIRALNDSRSHLAATLHELTAMNQNLEQMVATRTRELREIRMLPRLHRVPKAHSSPT